VLDIGCGTGALTLRAAIKGARVKGIDKNPMMLKIAQKKAIEANLTSNIEFSEMGVMELGDETSESYDAVMSGLCLSELSDEELIYTLKQIRRLLKPEGLLLIADEVMPTGIIKILLHWLIRIPLSTITYIVAQTTTKAIRDLPQRVQEAGLIIESIRLNLLEDFVELVAKRPR
jgi:demethylmenaquinone methyltransferase/2-methoxy-6-polyprenyl-1,4-benzoquinol methylase